MANKDVTITARWIDDASAPAEQTSKRIESSTRGMAQTSNKFVGEQMSRSMRRYNETTEKGRQLLMLMGGELGNAAGQAVYYGGTLGYIIGGVSKAHLGIMGLVAGVVALGAALINSSNKEWLAYQKSLAETKKATDELMASTEKFIETQLRSGQAAVEVQKSLVRLQLSREQQMIDETAAKLENSMGAMESTFGKMVTNVMPGLSTIGQAMRTEMADNLTDASGRVIGLKNQLLELDKVQAVLDKREKDRAGDKRSADEKAFGAKGGKDLFNEAEVEARRQKMMLDGEQAYYDASRAMQEENENRKMLIAANASALGNKRFEEDLKEQERIQQEHDAMMGQYEMEAKATAVGAIQALVEEGGAGLLRFLEMKMKMKAFEAMGEALWMTAMGFSYLANPALMYLAPAAFAAAGKWAAIAAVLGAGSMVVGAISGGGGGGGGSVSRVNDRGGMGNQWTSEGQQRAFVININAGVLTGADAGKQIASVLNQYDDRRNNQRERTSVS